MTFIADSMLGSLARWLRAMGQDVVYDAFMPDHLLLRRAREEGRVLLTRDTRMLLVRDLPPYLFISQDRLEDQLGQVLNHFSLTPREEDFLTRCLECNGALEQVDKAAVKELVPPYVFATQESFRRCPGCGRIFWAGTHLPRLREKLRRLVDSAEKR